MLGRFGPGGSAPTHPRAGLAGLVTAALAVTAVTNLAPLLSSGLAVQIRDDFDFDETALGLTIGSFYLVGALGSALSGRIVERVGPQVALRCTALATSAVLFGTGVLAGSWVLLTLFVALAGMTNAFAQPATNLYIARGVRPDRQGIAIGIQKSGIPAAALLGGLAVPVLGLTIGWHWAFIAGAGLALAASARVPPVASRPIGPAPQGPAQPATGKSGRPAGPTGPVEAAPAQPDVPVRLLVVLATATGLAASGSGSLSGFFVVSSVETGVSEAGAGILLGIGSLIGIAARLVLGVGADRGSLSAWKALTVMFLVAAAAFAGIATGSQALLMAAIPFAFSTAFAWPGLYHLAVVRANPSAPGAATGITMTGSFTGAVGGPLVFGLLADHASYGWAWGFTVVSMTAAAAVMTVVGRLIEGRADTAGLPSRAAARSAVDGRGPSQNR